MKTPVKVHKPTSSQSKIPKSSIIRNLEYSKNRNYLSALSAPSALIYQSANFPRLGIKKRERQIALSLSVGGGYLLSHFRSTIGVAGFNFSVRNGKRWIPRAVTAFVTCSELALLFASAFAFASVSASAFASASALVLGPPLRRGRSVWLGKELSAFAGRLCIVLRRCRRLYRFFSLSVLRFKTLLVSSRPFSDACRDYGLGLSP